MPCCHLARLLRAKMDPLKKSQAETVAELDALLPAVPSQMYKKGMTALLAGLKAHVEKGLLPKGSDWQVCVLRNYAIVSNRYVERLSFLRIGPTSLRCHPVKDSSRPSNVFTLTTFAPNSLSFLPVH